MKKLLTILFLSFALYSPAQVAVDKAGNYYTEKKTTASKVIATDTGKTFTDSKGVIYPVWLSVNGKLFVIKTSKAGNQYNYYLKIKK